MRVTGCPVYNGVFQLEFPVVDSFPHLPIQVTISQRVRHLKGSFPTTSVLGFLLLTGAFVYLLFDFWEHWDFPPHDGAYYYRQALRFSLFESSLHREWSPLYVSYYALFHWFFPEGNPFLIYSLHRLVTLYLVTSFFWLLCIRFFSWQIAIVLSAFLLCNEQILFNFHVIHAAGLLFVLLALWLATCGPRSNRALLLGVTICGYFIRPEFMVAFFTIAGITLFQLLTRREGNRPWLRPNVAVGFCLLLAASQWWISSKPTGHSGRAFAAFSQQMAWVKQGNLSMRAGWEHRSLANQTFGDAQTLREAILANPKEFGRHVAHNLVTLPRTLVETLVPLSVAPLVSMICFTFLFRIALVLGQSRNRALAAFWVPASAFALTSLTATLGFSSNTWYLFSAIPLVLVAPMALVSGVKKRFRFLTPWRSFLVMALLLGLCLVVVLAATAFRPVGQPVVDFSRAMVNNFPEVETRRVLAFSAISYCLCIKATPSQEAAYRTGCVRDGVFRWQR